MGNNQAPYSGRIRPAPGIVPRHEVAVGLVRVAVHQGAGVERVAHAAHLVLDGEERAVALDVDDVDEAVLVLVVLLADEAALQEAAVGT